MAPDAAREVVLDIVVDPGNSAREFRSPPVPPRKHRRTGRPVGRPRGSGKSRDNLYTLFAGVSRLAGESRAKEEEAKQAYEKAQLLRRIWTGADCYMLENRSHHTCPHRHRSLRSALSCRALTDRTLWERHEPSVVAHLDGRCYRLDPTRGSAIPCCAGDERPGLCERDVAAGLGGGEPTSSPSLSGSKPVSMRFEPEVTRLVLDSRSPLALVWEEKRRLLGLQARLKGGRPMRGVPSGFYALGNAWCVRCGTVVPNGSGCRRLTCPVCGGRMRTRQRNWMARGALLHPSRDGEPSA